MAESILFLSQFLGESSTSKLDGLRILLQFEDTDSEYTYDTINGVKKRS